MENSESRVEDILQATINGDPYDVPPRSRVEYLLLELKEVIVEGGGGGGTKDYEGLTNKPKINNVELIGNKTSQDLDIRGGVVATYENETLTFM